MSNSKTVPVKISRSDLCDILCSIRFIEAALRSEGFSVRKWQILRDKLKEKLAAFDARTGEEV